MDLPDRALRLAVAELAAQPRSDIDAVLEALPEAYSRRIAGLLTSVRSDTTSSSFAYLSPWLAERVQTGKGMTEHAAEVLLACAKRTMPTAAAEIHNPSLLGRIAAMFRAYRT